MAEYLTSLIKSNDRFKMVLPSLQVCFWYLPKGIEFLDQEVKDSKKYQMWEENITLVTKEIHKRIRDHGRFFSITLL